MNSTEFGLLLQSHGEEKARQLLDERYSLSGSQKPFLVLHDGVNDGGSASASAPKRRQGCPVKRASRRQQRKSLATQQLQQFRKSANPDYAGYVPLNQLWNEYMTTVLGRCSGVAAAQLVLSADWNGAKMRVLSCRNPACQTIRGILLYETKSQWLVATPSAGLKLLSKHGTVIVLEHPIQDFKIVGDRVSYRPSERTTRKFKPHEVADIAALLALS